jgi:hypothetical protein
MLSKPASNCDFMIMKCRKICDFIIMKCHHRKRSLGALVVGGGLALAGCQSDYPTGNRLPPEQELKPVDEEAPPSSVDPRRFSPQELEARDGAKALQDVENVGVKSR